ncbi:unnamed protein product [Victoria cruziana]
MGRKKVGVSSVNFPCQEIQGSCKKKTKYRLANFLASLFKGKGRSKLLPAPTSGFVEKLSGSCKKLFKKNLEVSKLEDMLNASDGLFPLNGTPRSDMKISVRSLKEKKHVNAQKLLGQCTTSENENDTDCPDLNGDKVKDGMWELVYEDPAGRTPLSVDSALPDPAYPESHCNPVHRSWSASGSTMMEKLEPYLQSHTTIVGTDNKQVIANEKGKPSKCLKRCSSILSSEKRTPASTCSVQFFVSCEEGINLYVDLNGNSYDWIKDLEAEVCIDQHGRDQKPNLIHHLTSKAKYVNNHLDASPRGLLEQGSQSLHHSSTSVLCLPPAGFDGERAVVPSVDCISICGQTVNQVLDAPQKLETGCASCLSECPATPERQPSEVKQSCMISALGSCRYMSDEIIYHLREGGSPSSAEMQDVVQFNHDYLPENNDARNGVSSGRSIRKISSMEAVKCSEETLNWFAPCLYGVPCLDIVAAAEKSERSEMVQQQPNSDLDRDAGKPLAENSMLQFSMEEDAGFLIDANNPIVIEVNNSSDKVQGQSDGSEVRERLENEGQCNNAHISHGKNEFITVKNLRSIKDIARGSSSVMTNSTRRRSMRFVTQ